MLNAYVLTFNYHNVFFSFFPTRLQELTASIHIVQNIDYGMPEKACKIYEHAIIQFGEKPILMDGFGELLVSSGDVDRAKEVLREREREKEGKRERGEDYTFVFMCLCV